MNQDLDPLSIVQQIIEVKKFFAVRQIVTPPTQNSNVLVKIWIEVEEPRDDSFIEIKDELPNIQCRSGEGILKNLTKEATKLAASNQADYSTNLLIGKILYKQTRFSLASEITNVTSLPPLIRMRLY